eukprot:TRINITY_DN7909_c0_g2_i2.p1 TRINITY_DN7909_c0_g2~~TRINITY_DN7909_c0_g2_i2.p1  ORF type:complete len:403 (+),score=30.85 TRINITY_DN7909_c0_g2_i2:640-1848(+)
MCVTKISIIIPTIFLLLCCSDASLVAAAERYDLVCTSAPEWFWANIACAPGMTVSSVLYARYGSTNVSTCGNEKAGECGAPSSVSVVENACLGQSQCSIQARDDLFGGDPCPSEQVKSLTISVMCYGIDPPTCSYTSPNGYVYDLSELDTTLSVSRGIYTWSVNPCGFVSTSSSSCNGASICQYDTVASVYRSAGQYTKQTISPLDKTLEDKGVSVTYSGGLNDGACPGPRSSLIWLSCDPSQSFPRLMFNVEASTCFYTFIVSSSHACSIEKSATTTTGGALTSFSNNNIAVFTTSNSQLATTAAAHSAATSFDAAVANAVVARAVTSTMAGFTTAVNAAIMTTARSAGTGDVVSSEGSGTPSSSYSTTNKPDISGSRHISSLARTLSLILVVLIILFLCY